MATAIDDKVMREHLATHYAYETFEIIEELAGMRLDGSEPESLRKMVNDARGLMELTEQGIRDERQP